MKSIYKAIQDINNYYGTAKYNIISRCVPTILYKKTGEIEYIYSEKVNQLLSWLDKECDRKINELIHESDIRRRFTTNEL